MDRKGNSSRIQFVGSSWVKMLIVRSKILSEVFVYNIVGLKIKCDYYISCVNVMVLLVF